MYLIGSGYVSHKLCIVYGHNLAEIQVASIHQDGLYVPCKSPTLFKAYDVRTIFYLYPL
ncbi:Uncharacterised protein [Psychrobacter phenylpyruvicus]|uniref:Uncharacterized protein n=1 Tax=Psychrobacter phenylpyruvicus TaxID=29432 RepID=A0A379LJN7_9GAMM|nr:Uncharacterised protein [Psychrobacter phenylpyruvicus]